ncbi:MAG: ribonuclease D [Syntrophaceae bacterium]|nr:ribonuclease D [Syntrophaceae bacterium]
MKGKWLWVDAKQKLSKVRDDIEGSPVIAIDTEYDSFRYFREKLCLLQIGTEQRIYLIDPLDTAMDLSFLGGVFANPNQVKVIHAGDNDIRILNRDYGFEFANVFDTHRAACLLGSNHLSLSSVIEQYLGLRLEKPKKMQRSRWEKRPLTEDQLHYAVEDTQHLIPLYRRLNAEIEAKGLQWQAARAFEGIAAVRWSEKKFNLRGYRGIPGYDTLSAEKKRRLRDLYRWRFRKAQETNTARFMILSDQDLFDIAKTDSLSLDGLVRSGGLSPKKAKIYGKEILGILISGDAEEKSR